MAEFHLDQTPYAYCYNNPIKSIDSLGLDTMSTQQLPNDKDDNIPGNCRGPSYSPMRVKSIHYTYHYPLVPSQFLSSFGWD